MSTVLLLADIRLQTKERSRRRSEKGESSAKGILLAAEALLIDEGYHNFSLRKVAARAEQTLGSLQYYFPTKDALVKAMLDNRIQRYLDMFEQIRADAGADPVDQFKALVAGIIRDLNTKTTTVFFPEVWSMANHDEQATEFVDAMYAAYRDVLVDVMGLINPKLSQRQLTRLAIFVSASMEGHTMFIGHGKPWKKETGNIIHIASQSFLWLIRRGEIPA